MREQGGGTLFSPAIDKKKVGPKLVESNDNKRRLSGAYASYLGGKAIASMPGGRLKGGSSIHSSNRHQERENGLPEQPVSEKTRGSPESEPQKRRAVDEGILPQWGHGKRSRYSRLEQSKHAGEESAILGKKAVRGADKHQAAAGSQANGAGKVQRQAILRPGMPLLVREAVTGVARSRNGEVGETADGVPAAAGKEKAAERREASSPEKSSSYGVQASRQREETGCSSGGAALVPAPPPWSCSPENVRAACACACASSALLFTNKTNNSSSKRASEGEAMAMVEWPCIVLSLSRKEKEDDFLSLKGSKLPQRPKKRPKAVEKALHYCTPGNWLSDLTRSRYDVREKKSVKKKPRGLRAMGSTDSESE